MCQTHSEYGTGPWQFALAAAPPADAPQSHPNDVQDIITIIIIITITTIIITIKQ